MRISTSFCQIFISNEPLRVALSWKNSKRDIGCQLFSARTIRQQTTWSFFDFDEIIIVNDAKLKIQEFFLDDKFPEKDGVCE